MCANAHFHNMEWKKELKYENYEKYEKYEICTYEKYV